MKQPNILLLDEPTASLDLEFTNIVMDIVQEYAKEHIVIIATHDQELFKIGHVEYEIVNHEVILKKSKPLENTNHNEVINKQSHISPFFLYRHMKDKNKIAYILISLFICLIIFISSSSLSAVVFENQFKDNQLRSVYQDEILVYKSPISKEFIYDFNGSGGEFPLTNDEVQQIRQYEHVKSIQPDYIFSCDDAIALEDILNFNTNSDNHIQLLSNHKKVIKKYNTLEHYNGLITCTYPKENNYFEDIAVELNNKKNGIYISNILAEELGILDQKQKYYLQFHMIIPTHLGYGDAEYSPDEGKTWFPETLTLGEKREVILPINGILKDCHMGVGIKQDLTIYISKENFEKEISAIKSQQKYTYYYSKKNYKYQLKLDRGDSPLNEMICQPFTPILYRVKVDKLKNLQSVISKLQEDGFDIEHETIPHFIDQFDSHTSQTILSISIFLYGTLTIVYGMSHYLQTKNHQNFVGFIKSFGYSSKDIKHLLTKIYLIETTIISTCIITLLLLYIYIIGPYIDYIIPVSEYAPLYVLPFAFVSLFVIPLMIFTLRKE